MCVLLLPQAINAELIPFLLGLLERDLVECDKPSATKAVIAESLKLMAKDLANGEKVGGAACGGRGFLWWAGLPVVGGATCGGWGYLWWVGLPGVGGDTCGGWCYLWWAGLPVVGGATCGGWGHLWWVGLPVVGGAIILYIVLYLLTKLWMLKLWLWLAYRYRD